ncbi:uncharacterized protein LOC122850382 [Aphidius gifuensis]|uniref:uncharacterized protein LOC122850382 n=1 Tax=Aphidius gifuensis TaxID=684658 RepID=UPI001CDCC31A|nr:uncharacterized protein LOC122850382 [Aphidius gifuensis]
MAEAMLSINTPIEFDSSISHYEIHAHQPYGSTTFGNSDEIRINIQNQDIFILPCKSSLHISGRLVTEKNDGSVAAALTTKIVNNGILHLFDKIRYEMNGVEIDRSKNTGMTSTLKNYLSVNPELNLENSGWLGTSDDISLTNTDGYFDVCIPLQMFLGFAEDYKKIIVNAKHELILIRSRSDMNACIGIGGAEEKDLKFQISKIEWLVPYVKLSDKKKIDMMKFIQRDPPISMSFRAWCLFEWPILPPTNKHVWSIQTRLW